MTTQGRAPTLHAWMTVLWLAGIFCMAGALGWSVMRRAFDSGPAALGLLGLAFYLASFIRAESGNLKHYLRVALYLVFTVGICTLIYLELRRYPFRVDLTDKKLHTLSEASRTYLQFLDKNVEIVVFDTDRTPYQDLLNRFAELSPRVGWSIHDPRRDPEFTRRFAPRVSEGMIFIVHGEGEQRKEKLISSGEFDESALINAMVEVTRERDPKIYFLTGHGELQFELPAPDASGNVPSLGIFKDFLKSRAMEVAPLDLVEQGFVPDDATVLVVAGPQGDLHPVEARLIENYLGKGGNLLLLFDLPDSARSVDFSNLVSILRRRGIEDDERVLMDLNGQRLQDSPLEIPVMAFNPDHEITKDLQRGAAPIFLPFVRALHPSEDPSEGPTPTPLAWSSDKAWAEPYAALMASFLQSGNYRASPDVENLRAMPVGYAVQTRAGSGQSRLVVFGSSDLVRNGYVNVHDTAARLMLNSIRWLAGQNDYVSVPLRAIPGTPLLLDNAQLQLVFILLALALPAMILIGGLSYVRFYRRD